MWHAIYKYIKRAITEPSVTNGFLDVKTISMQWAHFCVHGAILSAVYAFQLSTQIIDEEEKNRFLIDRLNHLVIIHW